MQWFKSRQQRFIEREVDNYLSSVRPEQMTPNVVAALSASIGAKFRREFHASGFVLSASIVSAPDYAFEYINKQLDRP